jgi:hypothetical protein
LKTKIIQIDNKPELNFHILGIACHDSDLRLSWAINQSLGFKLTHQNNIKYTANKKSPSLEFSVFSFSDDEKFINYELIQNRNEDGRFEKTYSNIDFFLKISGEIYPGEIEKLIQQLKTISIILTVFKIELSCFKQPEKFIF